MTSSRNERIYVAGHLGLVGSAIARRLQSEGYAKIITRPRDELDLCDQQKVREFFDSERPEVVFLAAALVGGINANNTYRWDFLYQNLEIQNNVLGSAIAFGSKRVVFLGSSCVYPKAAPQPMREEYLLGGPLEPTNEPYAIAKIAGLKLVEAACAQHDRQWVSLMPTNLYGPGDSFDLERSHVLPAMIRKFHTAKVKQSKGKEATVRLWGSGNVRREFLHVDDLARAAVDVMESGEIGVFNVGFGGDCTIRELAHLVAETVGYHGSIEWDSEQPDGTVRKLLDSSRILRTGWKPAISLRDGLRSTYEWYVANAADPEEP